MPRLTHSDLFWLSLVIAASFVFLATAPAEQDSSDLNGKVVLAADPTQPAPKTYVCAVPRPGVKVSGVHARMQIDLLTNDEGIFKARRSPVEMLVTARSADKTRGAIMILPAGAKELTVSLAPTASARGQLIDSVSGKPIARQKVSYNLCYTHNGSAITFFGGIRAGDAVTDALGNFTLTGIIVGGDYKLHVHTTQGKPQSFEIGSFRAERDAMIDLGELKWSPPEKEAN